jgi:hypothetical protein
MIAMMPAIPIGRSWWRWSLLVRLWRTIGGIRCGRRRWIWRSRLLFVLRQGDGGAERKGRSDEK